MLSKLIPKHNKYYYRTVIAIMLVLVGFVISAVSIIISGYYELNAINEEFKLSAKETLAYKQSFLYRETNKFKNYLSAVDKNLEFTNFIQKNPQANTDSKRHVTDIMMALTYSDQNIMQFRFIDKSGNEAIRIDRKSIGKSPFIVKNRFLQNKTTRYYFQDTKNISQDKIWFSNLDLNIEHGSIVHPIVPTLRVAKPYYFNDEFKGILIINIFMKDVLQELMKSDLFNVAIIDKEAYLLINNLHGYKDGEKEWTKYLDNTKDTKYQKDRNEENFLLAFLFKNKHFNFDISHIIPNSEGLQIVFEGKPEKFLEHIIHIKDYILIMGLIIFFISFPIAIVLSSYPVLLHEKLEDFKNKLAKKLSIIDNYVYMSRTDKDGNITDVSKAFTELSGYSRDELIGKTHRLIKDEQTELSVYKGMWNTILKGKKWVGLIKNIAKNGKPYWVKTYITPEIVDNEITGFTAISQNITEQKENEEISIRDELTQAYNRRYFNQTFSKELKRARRNKSTFCIAMFDIDYFKKYNDTYGHLKGDEALQKVVTTISKKLQRPGDYLFRIGGEEFIIQYSDFNNSDEAIDYSSKLLKSITDMQIEHKSSKVSDVLTISAGLLIITPNCTMNEESILKRIDELLYIAKDGGRNKLISEEC